MFLIIEKLEGVKIELESLMLSTGNGHRIVVNECPGTTLT